MTNSRSSCCRFDISSPRPVRCSNKIWQNLQLILRSKRSFGNTIKKIERVSGHLELFSKRLKARPPEKSLQSYTESAAKQLKIAFDQVDLYSVITSIGSRCNSTAAGNCFVDAISRSCSNNWEHFGFWYARVLLAVTEARQLYLEVPILVPSLRQECPQLAEDVLTGIIKDIIQSFESSYLAVKSKFLVGPCDDIKHEMCGARLRQDCCPLSRDLYQFLLQHETKDAKVKFAEDDGVQEEIELTTYLKKEYGQFEWSALIATNWKVSDKLWHIDPTSQSQIYIREWGLQR